MDYPQNELECVPYCTAAWQIREQEGGWSREQFDAFIDSLDVAIRQGPLRVRDEFGNEIPHPSTVHHIKWHLCPADFNKWQRESEHERHRWEVNKSHDVEYPALTAPVGAESVADRNARWLAIFDIEARRNPRGAQVRTMRQIVSSERVTDSTAKRGIQNAKKDRVTRSREGLGKPRKAEKNTAANPFGIVRANGNSSR